MLGFSTASAGALPRGLLLAAWLVCLLSSRATTREFQVRSWHTEDGLPDATITALAQTPDGYLWVGTPRGLARFDGVQFRVFESGATTGLPERHIAGLLAERNGRLWVAGIGGSLAHGDAGRFRAVSPPQPQGGGAAAGFVQIGGTDPEGGQQWMWGRVGELAQDRDGAIWLGVGGQGLLRWLNDKAVRYTPTNGLPAASLAALCSDRAGGLWMADGSTLYAHHDGQWHPASGAGSLGGPLPRLAAARAGGVWVAAPRGTWIAGGGVVRRFAEGQWFDGPDPTPWTPNSLRSQVTALLEDQAGHLWLGTRWGGVYYSDAAGRWHRLAGEGAFAQGVITCFYEDGQGAVWVGTNGEGLHRVTRQPVAMLYLPSPHDESIITTSTATREGSVWIGTDGAGAWRYREGDFTQFGTADGLAHQHVCSMLETTEGTLWAGTWGGLCRFRGRFETVPGPPEISLAVLALFEDSAGSLWIGTPRGPVQHRAGRFTLHPLRPGGGGADIRAFAEDAAGGIWVGTIGQGLFRLMGGRVEQFGAEQGFTSANARSLLRDRDGTIYVGSDGEGLFRHAAGRFSNFNRTDGLPSDSISSLIADTEGHLWMGTDNGIFACASAWLADYERGRSATLLGLRLGLAEGLASRSSSGSGQPVPSRTADGRVWFPNMRGLAVFEPRSVTVARPAAPLLIEAMLADGVEILPAANGERRVPSSTRRFEFNYTAPELTTPQALRFRHRLEGMDSDWVDAGVQRVAQYSQLPPDNYRFRVMVGGADGQWRESATPLAFRVVPRLWELRWVQVAAGVLVLAGAIAAFAWGAHRRLQRRLERLELQQALETERRRIARDLHDDLGARLTEIVLLGELAKRGEQTPGALQGQVGGITQKVRQLVTAMEEVVWTVNPKNDSLPNLAGFLADSTERFLAPAELSCRVDVAADLPPVPVKAQARHNLLLAVKEALNNAARHAAASQVRLGVHLEGHTLRITVADDGRGFDPQTPARRGNGLANLYSRLESVGGRTEITSAAGRGTTVRFWLPLPAMAEG
jgi:ligand-binding sensor domain-containing protein/signal transduction histidine kinase